MVEQRVQHIEEPWPEGESYRQAVGRVAEFLSELADQHGGERVVLIGHTATQWALDSLLNDVPLEGLVGAPFEWRPGWEYQLTDGWHRR